MTRITPRSPALARAGLLASVVAGVIGTLPPGAADAAEVRKAQPAKDATATQGAKAVAPAAAAKATSPQKTASPDPGMLHVGAGGEGRMAPLEGNDEKPRIPPRPRLDDSQAHVMDPSKVSQPPAPKATKGAKGAATLER